MNEHLIAMSCPVACILVGVARGMLAQVDQVDQTGMAPDAQAAVEQIRQAVRLTEEAIENAHAVIRAMDQGPRPSVN